METATQKNKKIWIDLDNSPHVPFFRPIINRLRENNIDVFITIRNCAQTKGLADLYGLEYLEMGKHFGKLILFKAYSTFTRTFKLLKYIRKEKPDLSVSHGSRSCTLVSSLLGIPSIGIFDYEHTKAIPFVKATWLMTPEIVGNKYIESSTHKILKYPGLKEFVYLREYSPDPDILDHLNLVGKKYIVIRPPATMAHYHNPEADKLFEETMKYFLALDDLNIVILPRYGTQETSIREKWGNSVSNGRVIIPAGVVNGLDLMWYSDGVVSGGGTMNREAAALGVPVYSIFRGKLGDIDRYLSDSGRLVLIINNDDIHEKIMLSDTHRNLGRSEISTETLDKVVENILYVLNYNEH